MAGIDTDVVTTPAPGGDTAPEPVAPADDPTAAGVAVLTTAAPPSLGDYVRAWWTRAKGGDSGMLPVLLGLLIIAVVFQVISPNHVFLHSDNLVNLFQQSAVFMVLGMAEIFVLLLGEIDLSVGF
ncbi:MAG TPA: hypothetical protein VFO60_09160, partial [Candidatus Dormibacteraeota bacterium]|nr:hypothetical protein [Candidatus Dormibacteraeota bacterium]